MISLSQARMSLATGRAPELMHWAVGNIDRRYRSFLSYAEGLPEGRAIYGTTTLPGHRDGTKVSLEAQTRHQAALIASHAIAGPPFLSAAAARAIGLAKLCSLLPDPAAPISADLYRHILCCFEDPAFAPAIPADASYGAGDVIPAAHWAQAVLARPGAPSHLQPGEGMTLINGAFVHVGATLAALDRLELLWQRMLDTIRHSIAVLAPDSDCLDPSPALDPVASAALEWLQTSVPPQAPYLRQQPVVLRTIPQLLDGFSGTATTVAATLSAALARPSGNPLFTEGPPAAHRVSGSFLEPGLTLATGAMVDAVLMVGWAAQRRLSHLIESHGAGADGADPIGLIQWPKFAEARLQSARRMAGLRAFAGGGSTSAGIEDFWAFGIETLTALDVAVEMAEDVISLERAAVQYLAERSGAARQLPTHPTLSDARAFAAEACRGTGAGVPSLF